MAGSWVTFFPDSLTQTQYFLLLAALFLPMSYHLSILIILRQPSIFSRDGSLLSPSRSPSSGSPPPTPPPLPRPRSYLTTYVHQHHQNVILASKSRPRFLSPPAVVFVFISLLHHPLLPLLLFSVRTFSPPPPCHPHLSLPNSGKINNNAAKTRQQNASWRRRRRRKVCRISSSLCELRYE